MRWKSVQYAGDPEDDDARFYHALKYQRRYSKEELLFDWDPFMGVMETYAYDEMTGVVTVKREQDCSTLLDDNAEWRASEQTWRKKDDRWLRYASIPVLIVEQWLAEGINVFLAETDRHGVPNEHLKAVLRKLRDPEWRYLMTVDMDMGTGDETGNTRLAHIPGNGLIWPTGDGL